MQLSITKLERRFKCLREEYYGKSEAKIQIFDSKNIALLTYFLYYYFCSFIVSGAKLV